MPFYHPREYDTLAVSKRLIIKSMKPSNCAIYLNFLQTQLNALKSEQKAISARRYFPAGIHSLGVTAKDITGVATEFRVRFEHLSATQTLALTETLLKKARYSEEVLLAHALINPYVKRNFDDDLLIRFQYWLEHYATNWSHVDDLCIKTAYQFLVARPHLIESTHIWSDSNSPWCRRASNVVWVKFIHRKIAKTIYHLNPELVFANTDKLLSDSDPFVQKSIGWLLKATSIHHPILVLEYLAQKHLLMPRATLNYALEKVTTEQRKAMQQLKTSHDQ